MHFSLWTVCPSQWNWYVGGLLPPYTVFKLVHLYHQWVVGDLKGAYYNRTQSGWFDEENSTIGFPKWHYLNCKQDGKKVMIGGIYLPT